jgi:hypothetical protein
MGRRASSREKQEERPRGTAAATVPNPTLRVSRGATLRGRKAGRG